jgi:hypothetical protein
MAFIIVSLQGDAPPFFGFHITGYGVVLAPCVSKVVKVIEIGVLDQEIIYHKGKDDGICLVLEGARDDANLIVSCLVEVRDESITCYLARLWQSIHAFVHPGINVPVIGDPLCQVVLGSNLIWYILPSEPDIFRVRQWVIQIKVFNV